MIPLMGPSPVKRARAISPTPYTDSRQLSFQFPTQYPNPLRPSRSPSPDVSLSQDCAFPPFLPKSRNGTPTIPIGVDQTLHPLKGDHQIQDAYSNLAPVSPRDGGENFLQKMAAIAPGPFQLSNETKFRPSGHRRTATMSSSKDLEFSPRARTGKGSKQQPSTAGSNDLEMPSLATISGGPRSTLTHNRSDKYKSPTRPAYSTRSETADIINPFIKSELARKESLTSILRQEHRSNTDPLRSFTTSHSQDSAAAAARRPSAPSLHVTRPSVAAAIRPLHEIGSVSYFKPSRSLKGRNQRSSGTIVTELSMTTGTREARHDQTVDGVPPVPASSHASKYTVGNPYHAPRESSSSDESFESDAKSGSSRSTPPLSRSPQKQNLQVSDSEFSGTFMNGFQFGLEASTAKEPSSHCGPFRPDGSIHKIPLSSQQPNQEPSSLRQGSTSDSAVHSGHSSVAKTPEDYLSPWSPLQSNNNQVPSALPALATDPTPQAPKSTRINKGRCRGCKEIIIGKSVCSADGRLTGRYHKRCFVCTTCKESFRTADFYILENNPYCEQHYHQLNNSICRHCERGIEGPYLETDLKQKFHPGCFKCQVSRINT